MRVMVDIPERLSRYLEFVPEEDMPGVVLEALEAKIFGSRSENRSVESQATVDEILSLLSVRIQSLGVGVQEQRDEIVQEVRNGDGCGADIIVSDVFSQDSVSDARDTGAAEDFDDFDNFDDLMNLMK